MQRAMILLRQSRFDLAERELRGVLAADPDDPYAHALLAECLVELKRLGEATDEAHEAIRLAPEDPIGHFVLASALDERNRLDEAVAAIEEAIRLDPEDADYFARLASIRFSQQRWKDALAAADQGLAQDAEHVGCGNLRAMALVKLGRRSEAGLTIGSQLARDPENSYTHANQGWALLHAADYPRALEHFREALRLDPANEWARQGIVEALKARYPLYGLMLRFFLWMSRFSTRGQWVVVVAGYIGYQVLLGIARSVPGLSPLATPIIVLYVGFAILTWIVSPLFNLALRLNRFGRLALSDEEVRASNWIGGLLLAALAAGVASLLTGQDTLLLGAGVLVVLAVPVSAIFRCDAGWPRVAMIAIAAALGVFVALGLLLAIAAPDSDAGGGILLLALVGAFFSTLPANALISVRPKR